MKKQILLVLLAALFIVNFASAAELLECYRGVNIYYGTWDKASPEPSEPDEDPAKSLICNPGVEYNKYFYDAVGYFPATLDQYTHKYRRACYTDTLAKVRGMIDQLLEHFVPDPECTSWPDYIDGAVPETENTDTTFFGCEKTEKRYMSTDECTQDVGMDCYYLSDFISQDQCTNYCNADTSTGSKWLYCPQNSSMLDLSWLISSVRECTATSKTYSSASECQSDLQSQGLITAGTACYPITIDGDAQCQAACEQTTPADTSIPIDEQYMYYCSSDGIKEPTEPFVPGTEGAIRVISNVDCYWQVQNKIECYDGTIIDCGSMVLEIWANRPIPMMPGEQNTQYTSPTAMDVVVDPNGEEFIETNISSQFISPYNQPSSTADPDIFYTNLRWDIELTSNGVFYTANVNYLLGEGCNNYKVNLWYLNKKTQKFVKAPLNNFERSFSEPDCLNCPEDTETIIEPIDQPECGNNICDWYIGEDEFNCSLDCSDVCVLDGKCSVGETATNCPGDCQIGNCNPYFEKFIEVGENEITVAGGAYCYTSMDIFFDYRPCCEFDCNDEDLKETERKTLALDQVNDHATTSFNIVDLSPNTEYCFRIYGRIGETRFTNYADSTTTLSSIATVPCSTPIYPIQDDKNIGLTPTLQWSGATTSQYYQFAIYEDDPAGSLRANGQTTDTFIELAEELSYGKHYYWIVNSCEDSELNNCSDWCGPYHFQVGYLLLPPVIVSPNAGTIYERNIMVEWGAIEHAGIYQYVAEREGAKLIDGTTSDLTFALNSLADGAYKIKVRACLDESLDYCSEWTEKSFEVKDITDDESSCNVIRIGTTKMQSGDNYPFLTRCSDGACPEYYIGTHNVMLEYPIRNTFDFYLLDEERDIIYSPETTTSLPIGKTLRLVVASIPIPPTDYNDPLLPRNNPDGRYAEYINSAIQAFDSGSNLILYNSEDSVTDYNVGVAADNPIRQDGFSAIPNEYFSLTNDGDAYYLETIKETDSDITYDAILTINVPKLYTYQTIDNKYLHKGCISSAGEQILRFSIGPERLGVDAIYDPVDKLVKINVSPEKDGLTYSLECTSEYQGQPVVLWTEQIPGQPNHFEVFLGGNKIDKDAVCTATVVDPEADKTYTDDVTVPQEDITDFKPEAPISVSNAYVDICKYPGVLRISWENSPDVAQTGFSLNIIEGANTIFSVTDEDYMGNSYSINIVDPLEDTDSTIKFTGNTRNLIAEIKIKAEHSAKWSDIKSGGIFALPKCPAIQPKIEFLEYNEKKSRLVFQGIEDNLNGLACGTPEWRWFTTDKELDAGWSKGDTDYYMYSGYTPGDTIYLRLRFTDADLGSVCEFTTSTSYGKLLQIEESK